MKDNLVPIINDFYEIMALIKSSDTRNDGVISCAASVRLAKEYNDYSAIVAVHYDRENTDAGLTVYWGDYALARKGLLEILNPSHCHMQLIGNKIEIEMQGELRVTIDIPSKH